MKLIKLTICTAIILASLALVKTETASASILFELFRNVQLFKSVNLVYTPPPCGSYSITDSRDTNNPTYDTVLVGTQCWLARNENVGTRIAMAGNQGTSCSSIQKYCYSDTDSNCTDNNPNRPDGGLYQWNQAMCGSISEGAQGICPSGWHIPTDGELYTLENYLKTGTCDGSRNGAWDCDPAGTKLKPSGTSSFEGNLAGRPGSCGSWLRGMYGHFLSSTQIDGSNAWERYLGSSYTTINRTGNDKTCAISVRCVKD
jgi:uncharacterized protein (TIGR02145 family)